MCLDYTLPSFLVYACANSFNEIPCANSMLGFYNKFCSSIPEVFESGMRQALSLGLLLQLWAGRRRGYGRWDATLCGWELRKLHGGCRVGMGRVTH